VITLKSKALIVRDFLLKDDYFLEHSGGIGRGCSFPRFELFARDYIKFSESELNKKTPVSLINCVGHLKRALECQIDTFLFAFNLNLIFEKRNLGIDKKLEFISEAGIFNSRSLSRLNKIRNTMEHRYEIPKIQDLDVFYDLVLAFIVVLENVSIVFHNDLTNEFYLNDIKNEDVQLGMFRSEYEHDDQSFIFSWEFKGEKTKILIDMNEPHEFARAFKIHLLLAQNEGFASDEYFTQELISMYT
jgi:hypothetical protein